MPRKVTVQLHSEQGRRPTNEDQELVMLNMRIKGEGVMAKDPDCAPVNIFIICDGHGGSELSAYVAPRLMNALSKKENVYPLEEEAVKNIYRSIHRQIRREIPKVAQECGTTALAVVHYVDPTDSRDYLQVFNTGDCRAVLSRNSYAVALTKDHKPSWPSEFERIAKVAAQTGEDVVPIFEYEDWRIKGLSVSRAFGDFAQRPYITQIPEQHTIRLQSRDQMIVMGCDGLWDVMENHDVINFIENHQIGRESLHWGTVRGNSNIVPYPSAAVKRSENHAEKLAHYAIAKGSTDNVSVIIVRFS